MRLWLFVGLVSLGAAKLHGGQDCGRDSDCESGRCTCTGLFQGGPHFCAPASRAQHCCSDRDCESGRCVGSGIFSGWVEKPVCGPVDNGAACWRQADCFEGSICLDRTTPGIPGVCSDGKRGSLCLWNAMCETGTCSEAHVCV